LVIHNESLTGLADRVRGGELSARSVVDHYLERSHRYQEVLNVYTAISDRGEERAEEIDRRVKAGDDPGPLAGVPIALKDLIDEQGSLTTCGSDFYRHRPEKSATVVRRLERAGAIIIGRTGLHEFAFGFSSENHWFGPVRNPWDPATSPGGSSGGSAAATAAGLAAASIGTDTGGSIRVPAALCGLFGLKVTHGRVPLTGVFPLAASLDTVGPLARSSEDLSLVYQVIAGHDPADPWSTPRPVASLEPQVNLQDLRIGVPQPWVADAPMSESVKETFSAALDRLEELGARVREIREPLLFPTRELGDLVNGEVASVHREWLADPSREYGPEVAERLSRTLRVSLDDYVAAQRWRTGLRHAAARIFEDIDFLVTPATGSTRKAIGEPAITVGDRPRSYRLVLSWFSSLVNHMGTPAVAMPLLHTSPPGPSLQVIGPWWSEVQLLSLGRHLEERGLVGFRPPPLW
jgi:aspartyl-tRNA(Asn)/glutamyl-tRNA(Gln) amidotransferase subunit A